MITSVERMGPNRLRWVENGRQQETSGPQVQIDHEEKGLRARQQVGSSPVVHNQSHQAFVVNPPTGNVRPMSDEEPLVPLDPDFYDPVLNRLQNQWPTPTHNIGQRMTVNYPNGVPVTLSNEEPLVPKDPTFEPLPTPNANRAALAMRNRTFGAPTTNEEMDDNLPLSR